MPTTHPHHNHLPLFIFTSTTSQHFDGAFAPSRLGIIEAFAGEATDKPMHKANTPNSVAC